MKWQLMERKIIVKEIQIRIFPDGKMQAETIGMKGKTCLKYIGEIEKLVDGTVTDSDFTGEYLETEESFYDSVEQEARN